MVLTDILAGIDIIGCLAVALMFAIAWACDCSGGTG